MAYEVRIRDWSSDVCSADRRAVRHSGGGDSPGQRRDRWLKRAEMRNAVAAGHEVAYGFLQQQGEAPAGSHQGIFGCPAGCPGSGPKQEGRAFMTTRLKSGLLAKRSEEHTSELQSLM